MLYVREKWVGPAELPLRCGLVMMKYTLNPGVRPSHRRNSRMKWHETVLGEMDLYVFLPEVSFWQKAASIPTRAASIDD
jgi:hypothetical protein